MFNFNISHILSMLEFVLCHTYIKSGEKYYLQKKGIGNGTGSHSSGAYAEILIDHTYTIAMEKSHHKPECLSTYVDDARLYWTSSPEDFEKFCGIFNSFWRSVNFKYELPANRKINFLDLTLELKETGEISYSHFQTPTASGRYLHYTAHCSLVNKTNIIRSETRRIVRNCKYREQCWKHLEKFKLNMIEKSGYPPEIVTKHVLQALEQIEKSTTSPLSGGNQDTTKSSASPDYVLKIPYINEAFTRKVSSTVRKAGINARIVTQAGRSVRSLINDEKVNTCKCELCNAGIDCDTRHFVYQASCNKCGDQYIGASRRPILNRIQEHESSVRINNARTTLGHHAARHRHDDGTVYVPTTELGISTASLSNTVSIFIL